MHAWILPAINNSSYCSSVEVNIPEVYMDFLETYVWH